MPGNHTKIKIIVVTFILFFGASLSSAVANECPELSTVPSPADEDHSFISAWQGLAQPWSIRLTSNDDLPVPHGIGYLKLYENNSYYYDWPIHILLPVWEDANARSFYGWIYNGKLKSEYQNADIVLAGSGMVETAYEHNNFIVWGESDDGWLQLKPELNKPPVWTHRCYLELGKAKLEYQDWVQFITEHGDWLHFRDGVPHRLRSGPNISSDQITMIGLDHKLTLLELDGDWMRVKVQQPDWTCTGPEQEFQGSEYEGWVKWRDEKLGPWVWVYTRGC